MSFLDRFFAKSTELTERATAARSTSYATVAENVARPCRGRVVRGVYDDGIEYLKIVLAFD